MLLNKLKNAKLYDDFIWHNRRYKLRTDINDFCQTRFEANIIRIILFCKGKYITYYDEILDKIIIVDIDGKLFNVKNAKIIVEYKLTDLFLDKLNYSRYKEKMFLITSAANNYQHEPYEMNRTYEWFENEYKKYLPLWETVQQNVDCTRDLYKKEWVVGKRELKRQHKKFFQPEGKSVKIGFLWKKQPFKGRPYFNQLFINKFKIYDSETNKVIFSYYNWGTIIQEVRRYLRDHALEYYNTNKFVICSGYISKKDIWVDIVKYDTMNNYYLQLDNFLSWTDQRRLEYMRNNSLALKEKRQLMLQNEKIVIKDYVKQDKEKYNKKYVINTFTKHDLNI